MKRCQPPAPLQPGDLLHVIAPSGTLREFTAFNQGIEVWRQRGYQVELMPGFDDRQGYLAGTDENRRTQLLTAFKDPNCRGILCARGGWGGARLLEKWRFPAVEPKWLIGFSDITSLLWAYAEQGISGVHAPLLTTITSEPDWSKTRLFDWVEGRSLPALQGSGWGDGQASGLLLPANLTVATHLLGTPWQPDFSGVILAIEDVTEAPYRIDRMLTQWRLCGEFRHIRGIAIGRFSQCDPPANVPSFSVEEVLRDRLSDLGIPIVTDLPFGHDGENAALPVGIPAEIDGDRGILSFQANT
ncbi:S66 peptidase family protein [Leptolyngbya sp. NIES-2104]|uniref:S66 peptidase family protein n=1 Tax=Leptolyngbya sp. NIES-2104 TaxID=1552121 RepID=UPI0006EC48CC|nr:LD-carboxypeptidase [Leptolyngbya sp. NIES-2104]GAP94468.1 muramoyltetrapeptide carboxypeptidase [Leptolyngbya sp. NIES-2104]